jgi:hypothetical protein
MQSGDKVVRGTVKTSVSTGCASPAACLGPRHHLPRVGAARYLRRPPALRPTQPLLALRMTAFRFDELEGLDSYWHLRNLILYNAQDTGQVENEFANHLGLRKKDDDTE